MNAVGYAFGYAVYALVTLPLREARFGMPGGQSYSERG